MDNYILISEATKILNVSANELDKLARGGKIKTVLLHDEILLRKSDIMAMQPKENFAALEGNPIGIGEASRKYKIAQPTISRWVQKGYITIIEQEGQKVLINEADVARMAAFYASRPGRGRRTDLDLQK
jgi:predicted site-specific integrase-resolvase